MTETKEGVINGVEEQKAEKKEIDRNDLSLQKFMDDMSFIGNQVRDPKLRKPFFHYGDVAISNYLLWLIYAELRMLNDKTDKWQNK